MILERTDKEILIRMKSNVDLTELQNMLDYLRYKKSIAQLFNLSILYADLNNLTENEAINK